MAVFVSKTPYLKIGSYDLGNRVKSLTLNYGNEVVDITSSGASTRFNLPGLLTWSIEAEVFQDYASTIANDYTDLVINQMIGSTQTVEVRPTNGNRSATNPGYNGTGVLESYEAVAGTVGDAAVSKLTIKAGGALTRSTA